MPLKDALSPFFDDDLDSSIFLSCNQATHAIGYCVALMCDKSVGARGTDTVIRASKATEGRHGVSAYSESLTDCGLKLGPQTGASSVLRAESQ
jgi:hypothetical protein